MLAPTARTAFAALALAMAGIPAGAQEAPRLGDLVINEVYYDPPDEQLEFVEVLNRSGRTLELRGTTLADRNRDPVALDRSLRLAPGGYAVLVRDREAFAAAFPAVEAVELTRWPALNNGGDEVRLAGPDGTELDLLSYEPGWGGSDGASSLERRDPAGPSSSPRNFGSSEAAAGATPGARNSLYAPDEDGPRLLFAEAAERHTIKLALSEPVRLPAASAFTLSDGTQPVRVGPAGPPFDLRLAFEDDVSARALTAFALADHTGNSVAEQQVAVAYPPSPGDLLVSEIMYEPRADAFDDRPDQPEYVEFASTSRRALSLRDLFWTDAVDERGAADTTRLGDELRRVAPGGRLLVYAEREDAPLADAFPALVDAAGDTLAMIPLARATLGLRNDGDLIVLQHAHGAVLDSVAYAPSWHSYGLRETSGVALERRALDLPAHRASNWGSSVAAAGGTPGAPNSVGLAASREPPTASLEAEPSPFSPDGDGVEDVTRLRYRLEAPSSLVRVRIFDSYGRAVRTLDDALLTSREGTLLWDGQGDDGEALRIGIYVVLLEALDAEGSRMQTLKAPVVVARPLD